MKKYSIFMLLSFLTALLATSFYMPQSTSAEEIYGLKYREGTWYRRDTGQSLEITSTTINGCPILNGEYDGGEAAGNGFAKYTITDDNGKTYVFTIGKISGFPCLIVNRKIPFFPSIEPQYYESINGLYLGMAPRDVINVWGQPTKVLESKRSDEIKVYYEKQKAVLRFDYNVLTTITLYTNSPCCFDKSGLNCQSPKIQFDGFYGQFKVYDGNDYIETKVAEHNYEYIIIKKSLSGIEHITLSYFGPM